MRSDQVVHGARFTPRGCSVCVRVCFAPAPSSPHPLPSPMRTCAGRATATWCRTRPCAPARRRASSTSSSSRPWRTSRAPQASRPRHSRPVTAPLIASSPHRLSPYRRRPRCSERGRRAGPRAPTAPPPARGSALQPSQRRLARRPLAGRDALRARGVEQHAGLGARERRGPRGHARGQAGGPYSSKPPSVPASTLNVIGPSRVMLSLR